VITHLLEKFAAARGAAGGAPDPLRELRIRAPALARMTQRFIASLAVLLAAACGERAPTVIDGSSPQAFERTVAQARRDIPIGDRLMFDRAIRTVGGRRHAERDPAALARVTFDGMTGAQVVADQRSRE
jgi:hypothetical protein